MTTLLPIRVLHIASGDLWAGAEVMLFNLVKAQSESSHTRPTVILLNPGILAERLENIGIKVYIISERNQSLVRLALRFFNQIKTNLPDVIHTHRRKENILGSVMGRFAGCPVSVRTVHGQSEQIKSVLNPKNYILESLDS